MCIPAELLKAGYRERKSEYLQHAKKLVYFCWRRWAFGCNEHTANIGMV